MGLNGPPGLLHVSEAMWNNADNKLSSLLTMDPLRGADTHSPHHVDYNSDNNTNNVFTYPEENMHPGKARSSLASPLGKLPLHYSPYNPYFPAHPGFSTNVPGYYIRHDSLRTDSLRRLGDSDSVRNESLRRLSDSDALMRREDRMTEISLSRREERSSLSNDLSLRREERDRNHDNLSRNGMDTALRNSSSSVSGSILGPLLMAPRQFVTPQYTQHEFVKPAEGRKLREALTREIPSPDKTDTDSGVYTDSEQDEPMDLSLGGLKNGHVKPLVGSVPPVGPFPEPHIPVSQPCPSPSSVDSGGFNVAIQDTSYLRDLLSRDRRNSSTSSTTGSEQPTVGPNTRVSLAKKNLLPVSARISDWLMKIVQFAESVPEFKVLTYNDKVNLVLSSWSRLLLLFMAENNFHFVVSPEMVDIEPPASPASTTSSSSTLADPSVPTMKCVETIQTIIRKFQVMNVDAKEYLMLRIAVLFQCEPAYLETPDIVSNVRHQVLECLRQHVNHTRPEDVMHYPKLLMALPILYTVDDKMLENLFCKHITGDTDVSVLLKEMLNNM